jgi:hypothetical protein
MKISRTKFAVIIFISFALTSCYTDVINSFQNFRFQIPFYFYLNYIDKSIPDTSRIFVNLNNYDEFLKHRDELASAEIVQFNYWVDSLVFSNNVAFDPERDSLIIENVRFVLIFARPKSGIVNPKDSSDFEEDTTLPRFVLGEFYNLDIRDFYRQPHHIKIISNEISQVLTEVVRSRPYFYLSSEYGKVLGQTTAKKYFSLVNVRIDIVIRFTISL